MSVQKMTHGYNNYSKLYIFPLNSRYIEKRLSNTLIISNDTILSHI